MPVTYSHVRSTQSRQSTRTARVVAADVRYIARYLCAAASNVARPTDRNRTPAERLATASPASRRNQTLLCPVGACGQQKPAWNPRSERLPRARSLLRRLAMFATAPSPSCPPTPLPIPVCTSVSRDSSQLLLCLQPHFHFSQRKLLCRLRLALLTPPRQGP